VPDVLSGVTVSGGCASAGGITLNQSPVAGTMVALGTHTITVTATDPAGNSASCTTTFTVNDTTAPSVISCPASQSIECPATPQFGTPAFNDACDSNLAVSFADEALPVSGNQASKTKRTWTATDAHNNSTTCSQTITVIDSAAPVVASCPADQSIECPATPPFGTPAFSDACGSNLTVSFADEALPVSGNQASKTKRTWTATDAHNNSTTCSQTITVIDRTTPVVATCPAAKTIAVPATPQFGTP